MLCLGCSVVEQEREDLPFDRPLHRISALELQSMWEQLSGTIAPTIPFGDATVRGFTNQATALAPSPGSTERADEWARLLGLEVAAKLQAPLAVDTIWADHVSGSGVKVWASEGAAEPWWWVLDDQPSVMDFSVPSDGMFRLELGIYWSAGEDFFMPAPKVAFQIDDREPEVRFLTSSDSLSAPQVFSADLDEGAHTFSVTLLNPNLGNEWVYDPETETIEVIGNHTQAIAMQGLRAWGPEPESPCEGTACADAVVDVAKLAWADVSTEQEASLRQLVADLQEVEPSSALPDALHAVFLAPSFQLRAQSAAQPTQMELARRLADLLWQGPIDRELREQVAAGTLRENLAAQVERMLADPRAGAARTSFLLEWLAISGLPDHPGLDPARGHAMLAAESDRFLSFDGDLRDWAVNAVVSPAVLTATSFSTRSSPSRRGAWVRRYLLCDPVPDPPPDVPAISAERAEAQDELSQHRENPACSGCHEQIDPIGMALDSLDQQGNPTAPGEPIPLPDGTVLASPEDLQTWLRGDPRLGPCVADRVATWALRSGVPNTAYDVISGQASADGMSWGAMMRAVTAHELFHGGAP